MFKDSLFFIGVFIFIFVAWLVTGGPTRPLTFSGPLLSGPGPLGGGTYLSLPRAPSTGGTLEGSHASGPSLTERLRYFQYEVQDLQKKTDDLTAFGASSPYRGLVSLSHY